MIKKLLIALIISSLPVAPAFAKASLDFAGTASTNNQLNNGNGSSLTLTSAVTHCLWVKPASVSAAYRWISLLPPSNVINTSPFAYYGSLQDASGNGRYTVVVSSLATNAYSRTTTDTLTTGWQFFCGTWDKNVNSGKVRLYRNLTETGYSSQVPLTVDVGNVGTDYITGTNGGATEAYTGQLAYLQVFNRIITDAEQAQIMYRPGSVTTGLVLYVAGWNSGDKDQSGNANDKSYGSDVTGSSDGPPVMLGGKGN